MADTVEQATQQIRERLKELEPLVEEQRRLQRALQALEPVGGRSTARGEAGVVLTRKRRPIDRLERLGSRFARPLRSLMGVDATCRDGVPVSKACREHDDVAALSDPQAGVRREGKLWQSTNWRAPDRYD